MPRLMQSFASATVVAVTACLLILAVPSEVRAEQGSAYEIDASIAEIFNIHRPSAYHYSAGQPTREQLSALADLGVVNVVNLRPPRETQDFNPAAWATEETMAYYTIPIAGGSDLTPEHVAIFDKVLTRIEGESSLLHCGSANRVGAMIALRAFWHLGYSLEDAIALGQDYGLTSLERHVREQAQAHPQGGAE